ncbi:hypothetical protein ABE178_15070 [Priestia megaterium]
MKELKVILSPHFNKDEFKEEVSGIVFHKVNGVECYAINLEDTKLSGIQSALRKNILLPYDRQTLEFVNGNNIAQDEKPIEEVQPEPEKPAEPVKEEPVEVSVEEVPKKTTRKRNTNKKESE